MTHQLKFAVLAVLAALMAPKTAGTAQAEAATYFEDKWYIHNSIANNISDTFQITLSTVHWLNVTDMAFTGEKFQVTINGVKKGTTSALLPNCTRYISNPDVAWTMPEYAKGTFPLPLGDTSIVITRIAGASTSRLARKVTTRGAAIAACQAEGRALADVTAANKDKLLTLVRASPAIKMNPVAAGIGGFRT
ncbi:hypothetical protein GGF32_008381 [Allomyces javanicus]|nr:hypothetical protein GGF32_008381 [Allomyces javanicus]